MITTPEIICDLLSFLDKDQIERIQLVNQFWNNVIIYHKNILPLQQFDLLGWNYDEIYLTRTSDHYSKEHFSYKIEFDGTNFSQIEEDVPSRYSQLTVYEVLKNLNDVVFYNIRIQDGDSEDNLLNLIKFVTAKTGGRLRGRNGVYYRGRFGSKLNEIFGKGFLSTARYKIHSN